MSTPFARVAVLALLVALGACGGTTVRPGDLAARLQGVWCSPAEDGHGCWAWDEFRADGTLAMCGRQEGDTRGFAATAEVAFDGPRMCYRVTTATRNFWLRPGQTYCTEIVEVRADAHVYRDIDTGARFTLFRRAAALRTCPAP